MDTPRPASHFFSRQTLLPILVLVCTSILAYLAIIQPWSLRETSLPLAVGDVASQDLSAPRNIQYVSNVLTAAARDEAERAVAPVYIPPDPAIARTQTASLTAILQSISLIRIDESASLEIKRLHCLPSGDSLSSPIQSTFFSACLIPAGPLFGTKPTMCLGKRCATLSGPRIWIRCARVLRR